MAVFLICVVFFLFLFFLKKKKLSIRSLTYIIPRWIIVTSHEHVSIVTNNPSATDPPRAPPHDLRVVAAHLAFGTGVGRVCVLLFLIGPRINCIRWRRRRAATPKYVLANGELALRKRML